MSNSIEGQISLLASIIESSNDAILSGTVDGIIQTWNPAAEKLYGYSSEEIIGKSITLLTPENRLTELTTVWDKVRNGQSVAHFETLRVGKNGLTIVVSVSIYPIRSAKGEIIGIGSNARDVTESKRASEYARSLIEASLDPLVTVSVEGTITDVNEATVNVTGVDRETLIGTDFSDYFTEPERARKGYQRVFAEGKVTNYPLTICHRNGECIDVLYNASVYRDAWGKVLGVFAAARDVTELKLTQAAITAQQGKELQQLAEHDRLVELERFQRLTIGRELKMIEMKKEIEHLKRLVLVDNGESDDQR